MIVVKDERKIDRERDQRVDQRVEGEFDGRCFAHGEECECDVRRNDVRGRPAKPDVDAGLIPGADEAQCDRREQQRRLRRTQLTPERHLPDRRHAHLR